MTANTYSHNQAFVESRRVHLRECDTGTVRRYVRGQSLSDWHPQQETNAFLFTNSFMPPTSQWVGQGHTPLALLIRENLQTHMRAITQHHPHSSAVTFGSARELSSELGATLPELYFKSTLMWRIVGRFFFFFFLLHFGRPSHANLHKVVLVWEIVTNDNLLFVCKVNYCWQQTKTCEGINKTKMLTLSTGDENTFQEQSPEFLRVIRVKQI